MRRLALVVGTFLVAAQSVSADASQTKVRSCRIGELALALGPEITPPNGHHPLSVRLVNRGRRACVLYGYPAVELRDRAGRIPFRIRRGGDQVVTSDRPARVVVRVGGSAFVVLSKYRCDRGPVRSARTLHLGLPGGMTARRSVALPRGRIAYCGRADPGSTVSVSPFESTLRAALQR